VNSATGRPGRIGIYWIADLLADAMPNALLKFQGYFLLLVNCIEVALLIFRQRTVVFLDME
jgi:hypothetical protein